MKSTLALWVIVISISCNSVKVSSSQSVVELMKQHYGEDVQYQYNTNKTYLLCWKSRTSTFQQPGNGLDFGIIDVRLNKLVYQETKYNATIKWLNDSTVLVSSRPGVHSIDPEVNKAMHSYEINVSTLKKR